MLLAPGVRSGRSHRCYFHWCVRSSHPPVLLQELSIAIANNCRCYWHQEFALAKAIDATFTGGFAQVIAVLLQELSIAIVNNCRCYWHQEFAQAEAIDATFTGVFAQVIHVHQIYQITKVFMWHQNHPTIQTGVCSG